VTFDEAWDDRAPGDLDGLPVNFIGAKDRIDAEELRKQKPPTSFERLYYRPPPTSKMVPVT
jgi:hypothetical protein